MEHRVGQIARHPHELAHESGRPLREVRVRARARVRDRVRITLTVTLMVMITVGLVRVMGRVRGLVNLGRKHGL